MMVPTRNVVRVVLAAGLLLLLPLLAMLWTGELAWGPADFVLAGLLLVGTGLLYEWVVSRMNGAGYRLAVGLALATAILLVWVNLAVGLIGSEDHPANRMYAGVLAVGLVGAFLARLEPRAMARVLFATAVAQALVAVIATTLWTLPATSGVAEVLGVNAFFVALWVGSALLFRRAATRREAERMA
jgi:Kef-type K+ transport system membrane component KefB